MARKDRLHSVIQASLGYKTLSQKGRAVVTVMVVTIVKTYKKCKRMIVGEVSDTVLGDLCKTLGLIHSTARKEKGIKKENVI